MREGPGQPRNRRRRGAQGRLPQPHGPGDQGGRGPRLRRLPHRAIEELITKTRESKLTADDFQGTNISPDQPRRDRHDRLGAAPARAARARSSPPARSPIRPSGRTPSPERIKPARRLQGDDADLDLRPPRHPGRRVGRAFCAGSSSCCRARTTSTRHSPPTSASRPPRSPTPTLPPPPPRPCQRAAPAAEAPASTARSTRSCCRRSRRRPRC